MFCACGVVKREVPTLIRRFAPDKGFMCGAVYAECEDDGPAVLVFKDGKRMPVKRWTLARCYRYVFKGLWKEIPTGGRRD